MYIQSTPATFYYWYYQLWCDIYEHIRMIPDGYKVAYDRLFTTKRPLDNKLIKKENPTSVRTEKTARDATLTYLRQCSEWGNRNLTGIFCFLSLKLSTDNCEKSIVFMVCSLIK